MTYILIGLIVLVIVLTCILWALVVALNEIGSLIDVVTKDRLK
jgi:hypothetical protein